MPESGNNKTRCLLSDTGANGRLPLSATAEIIAPNVVIGTSSVF
jgi:hypothetical protein